MNILSPSQAAPNPSALKSFFDDPQNYDDDTSDGSTPTNVLSAMHSFSEPEQSDIGKSDSLTTIMQDNPLARAKKAKVALDSSKQPKLDPSIISSVNVTLPSTFLLTPNLSWEEAFSEKHQ